jgi:peptidoglycan hydrolase-like protein with peptidoglycan-binding domain
MRGLTRSGRLAKIGASALAVAVIAAVGGLAGSASAAPAAPGKTALTAAPVAPAKGYTPPKRDLQEGDSGADVKALQVRLTTLKYYPGPEDGQFGPDTEEAVWAFQEVNGVKVTGVVDAATKKALVNPKTYKSASYKGKDATRIEVSQALEVMVYYKNNRIRLISHVSSGGGYYYDCGSDGCAQAVTPNGTYYINSFYPGWIQVPLGEMYNSLFFIDTEYAIHGDTFVPVYPDSHGCVRIPMDIASWFYKMVKVPGTQVHVYGKPQWES